MVSVPTLHPKTAYALGFYSCAALRLQIAPLPDPVSAAATGCHDVKSGEEGGPRRVGNEEISGLGGAGSFERWPGGGIRSGSEHCPKPRFAEGGPEAAEGNEEVFEGTAKSAAEND
jgi:hypothetical protein